MEHVAQGIHDEGEAAEEGNEGDDACVEEGLIAEHVGQLHAGKQTQSQIQLDTVSLSVQMETAGRGGVASGSYRLPIHELCRSSLLLGYR